MTAPSYTFLDSREWDRRIAAARAIASPCALCPRRCGVNRPAGEQGFCRGGNEPVISSIFPHQGEEPPLTGSSGSGTVFFTHCTLRCVFCQNWQISHEAEGRPYSPAELAERMLWLQESGCHNINLVTPTHFLPWILSSLKEAAGQGLSIPLVYNCGGYELPETLHLLDGIVDIYLPDMKYGDNEAAQRYSGAPDYVPINRAAIRGMFRQTGPLKTDRRGIAKRGLCIRHLVLPGHRAGSEKILAFLQQHFDPADIYLSLMAQYSPCYRAGSYPEINRRLKTDEYEPVLTLFRQAGFNGYFQELPRMDASFLINFLKHKSEPLTGE